MADRSALTELRLLDSDSDVDDLVHVVETSASQFTIALNTLHKVVNTNRLEPSQYVSKRKLNRMFCFVAGILKIVTKPRFPIKGK